MTERAPGQARAQGAPRAQLPADADDGAGGAARPRRRHPLLGAFPLTVMTLATFLVLFTLMMARLTAGADPALRAGSGAGAVVEQVASGSAVRTRTSGGGAVSATPVAATHGPSAATPAVLTRSSGSAAAGVRSDD